MGLRRQLVTAMWVGATALGTGCATARAQKPILPICSDDPKQKLPPCKTGEAPVVVAPGSPSTVTPTTQFPFPGDGAGTEQKPGTAPASPSDQFPFPGEVPANTPAAAPAKTPTSDQFPFPGEPVPAPVKDPNEKVFHPDGEADPAEKGASSAPKGTDGGDSSSSSSSSSSSDSSSSSSDTVPRFKDEGSEGSTRTQRRRLPKVEDMGAREEEDIRVAKFYHSTGNYLGAYLRAKDAIKIDPEDPEAHYALAINAEKLSKKDEARDGYTVYLKLEPDGRDAKAAKQALADLR